jgi:hypothetical protein
MLRIWVELKHRRRNPAHLTRIEHRNITNSRISSQLQNLFCSVPNYDVFAHAMLNNPKHRTREAVGNCPRIKHDAEGRERADHVHVEASL